MIMQTPVGRDEQTLSPYPLPDSCDSNSAPSVPISNNVSSSRLLLAAVGSRCAIYTPMSWELSQLVLPHVIRSMQSIRSAWIYGGYTGGPHTGDVKLRMSTVLCNQNYEHGAPERRCITYRTKFKLYYTPNQSSHRLNLSTLV